MKSGNMTVLASLAALTLPGCSGDASAPEPTAQATNPEASFVADSFKVPTRIEADGFVLVPLGPDLAEIDYAAYMSSIEHLQKTFTRSTGWPRADLTMDDAMKDMETEQGRFERRESFAYAVLTPDGSRERGCVYVYPGVGEFDAVVRLWVTKAEYDAGFDEELYAWTQSWIASDWRFDNAAYPGRAIAWKDWDALTKSDEDS
ncbi:MAG: twin-arginine translocation pathway signal protein [Pseudomonadota bacterium]